MVKEIRNLSINGDFVGIFVIVNELKVLNKIGVFESDIKIV